LELDEDRQADTVVSFSQELYANTMALQTAAASLCYAAKFQMPMI
jgi:hypothetical protein